MKLTCSRETLLNSINISSKAVSSRTTIPILECLLLTANERGFFLTGNDMELGIEEEAEGADIIKEGSIALESRLFSEMIRRADGDIVSIETDSKNNVDLICGNSKYHIMGQPGDEFPSLPQIEKDLEYTLSQLDLKNMIRQTIFSIAQEESKPVLLGELLEMKENYMNMVSVDGYRISYKKAVLQKENGITSAIVPGKTLSEISKILSTEPEDTAHLYFTDKHILIDLGKSTVVSRLIEGEFIRYAQSFSEDYKTKISGTRTELLSALERVSLISKDVKKTPVKIEILQNCIVMSTNTEIGHAQEEIHLEVEGEPLNIAFNPKYLMDALRVIDDEKVAIQFTTSLSPCIIKPIDGEDYKYLILPLRM